MIGQSIMHYRITSKLGQGGMGAVYRATDTKLDREVAIKVLPETFAQDKERLIRFGREAKALAALNHPNIAAIHGLEQTGNSQALILELVEGEDLSERLKRGPLPVEEALDVCKQIAEALEAAHEKGIIHRDLKPGNIKLLPDGRVKVLDFGLAKTASADSASTDPDSPTLTADYTMPGVLLGTAGYMSPEQARGKPVDKRSDIWSFGVVLFECLTGRRLFPGETVTDSIGALLHKEIDWSLLPADTPPAIQLLLRKCLARDRKRRLQDSGDARVDLEQVIVDPSSLFMRLREGTLREAEARLGIPRLLVAGLVLGTALAAAGLMWLLRPNPPPIPERPRIQKVQMSLGLESPLELDTFQASTSLRFSPDGSTLAFLAMSAEGTSNQLFLRRLDLLEATPVTAARNCSDFCFSPDGRWIAFRDRTDLQIKKVSVDGGTAFALCPAEEPLSGMAWSDDDRIAFALGQGGIQRISASRAGDVEKLTTLQNLEYAHRWPYFLPGGRALLFSVSRTGGPVGPLMIQSLPNGEARPLGIDGHHPRYLSGGHLVFIHNEKVYGVAFDLRTLEIRGTPVRLVDRIEENWPDGACLDVSIDGTLVHASKKPLPATELEWVDRKGNRRPALSGGDRGNYRLSPNGRYIACFNREDRLMIYDLERGTQSILNLELFGFDFPLWTPSGQAVVLAGTTNRSEDMLHLYWQPIDGRGARLLKVNERFPISWRLDGTQLLTYMSGDLRLLQVTGDDQAGREAGEATNFQTTAANEEYGCFSPDGQWIAFTVEEREQIDVYVSRADRPGRRTKISTSPNARGMPTWTSSNEILYGEPLATGDLRENQVMIVECTIEGETLSANRPVPWINSAFYSWFDYDPVGNRLLVAKLAEGEEVPRHEHVVLWLNFDEYVSRQVPLVSSP